MGMAAILFSDLDHLYKLSFPLPKEAPYDGEAVSEKKMFENNDHIHVYNPGAGEDNSLGTSFVKNINFLSSWSFTASFSKLMNL